MDTLRLLSLAASVLTLPLTLQIAGAAPPKTPPPPPPQTGATTAVPPDGDRIPEGSGDYAKMMAAAVRYKKREIGFEQLKQIVVAAKLPPHPLGCAYVIAPVPAPPPGTPFDPALMPHDWEHTFGEVAMTFWAGKITQQEYDKLHAAAHKDQPGFPQCRRSGPPGPSGPPLPPGPPRP